MTVVVAAVVLAGAVPVWRQSRSAAALPAAAAAAHALTFEPADALIGPAGATSVLGAVHTPSGSIAAFAGEVTATSNAACPPDAFSIALDPTGPADARVLITLRGDAPGACEGVRLDWRLSAR